jgi:hypothetical protein
VLRKEDNLALDQKKFEDALARDLVAEKLVVVVKEKSREIISVGCSAPFIVNWAYVMPKDASRPISSS